LARVRAAAVQAERVAEAERVGAVEPTAAGVCGKRVRPPVEGAVAEVSAAESQVAPAVVGVRAVEVHLVAVVPGLVRVKEAVARAAPAVASAMAAEDQEAGGPVVLVEVLAAETNLENG
jgi:hypothetical protein